MWYFLELISNSCPGGSKPQNDFAINIDGMTQNSATHLVNFCPCHSPSGKVTKPKLSQACHGHGGVDLIETYIKGRSN